MKPLHCICALAVLASVPYTAKAETYFKVGDLEYVINEDSVTVGVIGYKEVSGYLTPQRADYSSITQVDIPPQVTYLGKDYQVTSVTFDAFSGYTNIKSVHFPEGLISIGGESFSFSGLEGSLVIPNSVKEMGMAAFSNCHGITSLALSKSLKQIPSSAFFGCDGLKGSLILPEVSTIGDGAFDNCTGFDGFLYIPSTVTNIDAFAFYGCSGFKRIYSRCPDPSNVQLGEMVFNGMDYSACTLYVPRGTVELYRKADQWKEFKHIVEECEYHPYDLNGDGQVDVTDVNLLIDHILGR